MLLTFYDKDASLGMTLNLVLGVGSAIMPAPLPPSMPTEGLATNRLVVINAMLVLDTSGDDPAFIGAFRASFIANGPSDGSAWPHAPHIGALTGHDIARVSNFDGPHAYSAYSLINCEGFSMARLADRNVEFALCR